MSIESCKDPQSQVFLKDYKIAEKEPDHLAGDGLRAKITTFNNTNYNETIQEAGELFYMGMNPRIHSVLEDSLIAQDLIEATRQLMKSTIEGIVIVDEGFVINSLKQFMMSHYARGNTFQIEALRTEARVIGERQKMLVQAIQEQLILSGQVSLEDYKPVVLLSDVIDLTEVNRLFKKIVDLSRKNKDVLDRLLKCIPPPIRQSNLLLGKRGSKSLKRLTVEVREINIVPTPDFSDFLAQNGLLNLARETVELNSTPINEPLLARHTGAYTAFQFAVGFAMAKKIRINKTKPRVKWGFSGEIPYDEVAHFLLKNYAKELGLEDQDIVFRTAYFPNERARIPYKATKLICGQPTLFPTISMAPSQASAEHSITEQMAALMDSDIFPILENQLWNIKKNKRLIDQPAWAPSSKELYYQDRFGGNIFYESIKRRPDCSLYAKNLFLQVLPVKQPVRSELKRLKVMSLLRQLAAMLSQDERIISVLEQSGVMPILKREQPISNLHRLNNLNLGIDPLDVFQKKVAEITHLREKIECLEADCRRYEQEIALLGEKRVTHNNVTNELKEGLEFIIHEERQRLWQLIANIQEEGKSQNDQAFHECPEAYLIRHMAKALSGVVHQNPELAEALTHFFRRLTRVLHPKMELTLDLHQPYWQVAA